MRATHIGLFVGLILGVAAAAGGFTGFLLTLFIAAIGLVVGRIVDGDLEIGELLDKVGRGRDR